MSDLSLKTAKGILWSIGENLGLQLMRFSLSVVIARLLLPEQFGLIGMLSLFMALAQSLLDSGFGAALIQKRSVSRVDTCSVFYFNLLVSVLLALALCGVAPLIAEFYSEPILTPLTRFLSLNLVVNAFGLVPLTLLIKRMDFKSVLKANLVSVVLSGILSIGLALLGFGVWSLAVQSVSVTMMRAILIWTLGGWRPARVFSLESLKRLFPFGSHLLLSGLLDTFFLNIYQPIIGKAFSAVDLGYYVRAQSMQTSVVHTTGSALARVMFPALSSIQDDRIKLKQACRKAITTTAFFHIPLMLGLIIMAEPLIVLLMTEKWAPSVPYFQLLCIVGLLYPLHVLNLNILKVVGRSDLFFRLEVMKKALVVASIAITYRWGITGLLYGQVATSIVAYYLNSFYSGRLADYSAADQIRDIFPAFLTAGLVAGTMYLVGTTITDSSALKLLVQSTTGVAFYLGLNRLMGNTVFHEVIRLIRQVFRPQMVS